MLRKLFQFRCLVNQPNQDVSSYSALKIDVGNKELKVEWLFDSFNSLYSIYQLSGKFFAKKQSDLNLI